jgi:hypothetical protein
MYKEKRRENGKGRMRQAWREGRLTLKMPDVAAALDAIDRNPLDPRPAQLDGFAAGILSQHGEDGITYELLKRVGMATTNRVCVEIGAGHNGGNAGFLVAGLGYRGLFLDGDEELVEIGRRFFDGCDVTYLHSWISPDSVDDLLKRHGFVGDIDYLGIDLDSLDYWVWDAIRVASPKLVVIEYNQMFGAELAVTVPKIEGFRRAERTAEGRMRWPKGYYGASLRAIARLGAAKGYRLVGTAPQGSNAYLVRDDVASDTPAMSVTDAYRHPSKLNHLRLLETIERVTPATYFARAGVELVEIMEPETPHVSTS